MINYKSTRGNKNIYSFSETILKGIADDGGLFVPEKIPSFSLQELSSLVHKSYKEIALFVFQKFETDFSEKTLKKIVNIAYGKTFDTHLIAPIKYIKDTQYLLELFHGPTAAFKDFALQMLPNLFVEALKKHKKNGPYLILAATSGDTGKAAMAGYKNKEQVSVLVLYPENGISSLQKLSMQTQEGKNVKAMAVTGNFDDCQRLVKEIFTEKKFTHLSSANSINWGRVLPQIAYHLYAYTLLIQQKVITIGDEITLAIPTGNFGNALAAAYAKHMGLPIKKIICASNENNAVSTFLQTGRYDIREKSLVKTPSPAMDILVSSNIERLLFLLTDDSNKTTQWLKDLKEKKFFEVDTKTKKLLQELFYADWVTNADCLRNIATVFDKTGYLMDPHTSVAQFVADHSPSNVEYIPLIICSTAHWSKFPEAIKNAFRFPQEEKKDTNVFSLLKQISHSTNSPVPRSIITLQKKPLLHTKIIPAEKDAIEKVISEYV